MLSDVLEEVSEQLITSPEKQPEEKNKGGRPFGAKTRPPDPGFFDRLKELDWEKHLLYLYRLQPLVDRTSGGDPKYILKYSEAIDEDRVMQDHGSGVYQVRLTKSKEGSAKTNEIERHTFEIFNIKYPPQIPVGVWLEDHRNERWKGFKEIMQATPAPAQSPGGQQDPGKLVQTIFQEVGKMQVNPNEQFKAQTEIYKLGLADAKQNTAAPADGSLALLEKLIPLLTPKPQDNSVVQVLTLQLEAEREQRKADREQAKADREAADKRAEAAEKRHNDLLQVMIAKKENTGMDVITQFTGMFNMFKSITEGGLGATDDSWSALGKEALREIIPHAAPAVAPMLTGLLSGAAQFAGGGARPTPPGQPAPAPPPSGPQPSPATPPQPQPQQHQHQIQQLEPEKYGPAYSCIFMSQGTILKHMRDGKSGLDFGDWLANGPGELEIEKLKAAGPDRIVQFIATQLPPLWSELQPVEAKFRVFLGELMAWEPQDEDEPPATGAAPLFPGGAMPKAAPKKKIGKKGVN